MSEIPRVITFQGKLTDSTSNLLNGPNDLTFRIYDVPDGGIKLWQESHPQTPVTRGTFAVPLGVTVPLELAFDTNYWVSVEVGSTGEMTPRQRLSAAPYAIRSATAELADDATHAITSSGLAGHFGLVPIGTVQAWLKDLPGVPNLPENFVECNGQVLHDQESPLNQQVIPNLNGNNRFLRGSTRTGGTGGEEEVTLEIDETPSHNHSIKYGPAGDVGFDEIREASSHLRDTGHRGGNKISWSSAVYEMTKSGGDQPHENRPPYYDVVWIIRVK